MDLVKTNYMVLVIALLGIFAFFTAVLVAWPALTFYRQTVQLNTT